MTDFNHTTNKIHIRQFIITLHIILLRNALLLSTLVLFMFSTTTTTTTTKMCVDLNSCQEKWAHFTSKGCEGECGVGGC